MTVGDESTLPAVGDAPTEAAGGGEDPLKAAVKHRVLGVDEFPRIGRLSVRRRLGRGGMGVVYAAHDPELDREVAVKVVGTIREDSQGRPRMLREAQAMARLSHPNVVAVHDVGTHAERVYISMELVKGGTLADWLQREDRPWRDVVSMFVQAGRGLAAAHEAGLVHRDFKPDNVLVGADQRPQVADFGLVADPGAQAAGLKLDEAEGDSTPLERRLTETGALLGTPMYMSPEQFEGRSLDTRSDQFSFCVSLYLALVGVHPFKGEKRHELVLSVIKGQRRPTPKSRVPARVLQVLERGLAVDPADRYPDMGSLLTALERAASRRRTRWLVAGLAAAGLAGSIGGASLYAVSQPDLCPSVEEHVGAIWNEDRRAQIESHIEATAGDRAERAWQTIDSGLELYAYDWATLYTAACQDGDSEVAVARRRCLESRLVDLEAATEVFASASPSLARAPRSVLAGLTPVSACESDQPVALLENVLQSEVDRRAYARLVEARALFNVGEDPLAFEIATEVAADTELADAIRADAMVLQGQISAFNGEIDLDLKEVGGQALALAERAGQERIATRAQALMVYRVRSATELVRGRIERVDDPEAIFMLSDAIWDNVLASGGDFEGLERTARKAVARLDPAHAFNSHAPSVLLKPPDVVTARRRLEEAIDQFGDPSRPAAVHGRRLSWVLADAGDRDGVRSLEARQVERWRALEGPLGPNYLEALSSHVATIVRDGEAQRAAVQFDWLVACTSVRAAVWPDRDQNWSDLASALAHRAGHRLDWGELEAALEDVEAARALDASSTWKQDTEIEVLLELGHEAEAVARARALWPELDEMVRSDHHAVGRAYARGLFAEGKTTEALTVLSGLDTDTSVGRAFRTQVDLARMLHANGNAEAARAARGEAERILDRSAATPFRDRGHAVLDRLKAEEPTK